MQLRRLFQFRLRTLLIVATLLCVALVIFVLPARQKWQAVRTLEQRGVVFNYELSPSPWQQWSRDRGCDWGPPVDTITWHGNTLTERDRRLIAVCQPHCLALHRKQLLAEPDLAWVARLPSLRHLVLEWSLTEAQLRSLQPARHLEILVIHTPQNDTTWRALTSLTQVRELYLSVAPLNTEGLAQLVTMRHLQKLYAPSSDLTQEQKDELRAALPKCQVWNLPY